MNIELTKKQKNIISILESGAKTIICQPATGQSTILSKLAIERTKKKQKTRIIADSYAMSLLVSYLLSMINSEKDIIATRTLGSGLNNISLSIDGEVYVTASEGSSYQCYLEDDELVLEVGVHDCEFINSPPKNVKHSKLFRLMDVYSDKTSINPLICWEKAARECWLLSEYDPSIVTGLGYERFIKPNLDVCENKLIQSGYSLCHLDKI